MGLRFYPAPEKEEAEIRDLSSRFARSRLAPTAIEDDARSCFRRELFNELARIKLNAVSVPVAYGGLGLPARCYYSCLEEIARVSPSMAIVVGVTNLIQGALQQFGTDTQKETCLRRLILGEWLGAFSLSESNAGSDAASLQLAARRVPGGYRINGTKIWCSSAGHADLYLVMGRTGPDRVKGISSFLVPERTEGFRVGKQEKKLGLRASSLAELVFEDCFLPESQRLGDEGEGLTVALSQLDAGRITIGAVGVGIATEAIERVWRYRASQQEQGAPELEEGSQQQLGEHYAKLQAVRTLVLAAASQKDAQGRLTVLASQVKLLGSELAVRVCQDAIHFMGPAGVVRENEVERMLRDSKALQIVEGTNQIQRMLLAREIGAMMR